MKSTKIITLVVASVLVAGFISGYVASHVNAENGDEVVLYHDFDEGDTWTYTIDEGDWEEMSVTFTVEDEDATYDGHDVSKMSIDMDVDDHEDEHGNEFRDMSGSGTAYENKDFEYVEMEMTGEMSPAEEEEWQDISIETEEKIEVIEGSYPEEAEIGETFEVTREIESTSTTQVGDEEWDDESEETEEREYTIEGKETVTVEAGEFEDCVHISWSTEDENGEIWYSSEVKRHVRQETYDEDGEITSEIELRDYEVEEDDDDVIPGFTSILLLSAAVIATAIYYKRNR